jgi:hypothetical protein
MSTAPKVFICHASEDKERFVIPFAVALRAKGVDAWVDKFEILAGESIVSKIFDEGVEEAKAVIAVISEASIKKPWVKAELDVAVVRRIEGKAKLIPVVLEAAQVPNALSALRWESVGDVKHFDVALHNVIQSVFDQYERPPLGASPHFVTEQVAAIPGVSTGDAKILAACCRASERLNKIFMDGQDFEKIKAEYGASEEVFSESLLVLARNGFVKLDQMDGGYILGFNVTTKGYDSFLRANDRDYVAHFRQVIARIINDGDKGGDQIVQATGLLPRTAFHFVQILHFNKHLVLHDMSHYGCEKFTIAAPSPTLRRLLEN